MRCTLIRPMFDRLCVTLATGCLLGLALAAANASEPTVAQGGKQLQDSRLGELKDLNGYFPYSVPATRHDWQKRADEVRRRVKVALGLWPPPSRTPLHPVVHGRADFGDYTIEKVFFESMPGFYVTGNLYRPVNVKGKVPGILCPHGHWSQGRFTDAGLKSAREQIVNGAERFEEGGRSPLQSRCVQLARMGCVVFHYDMIGYADSKQLSFELAHRFAKQRPDAISPKSWGLFSPQAESQLQSIMGLQTWNSIRSVDFLLQLPDVDPQRIAVTGASGGGTQSFILAAVEPRLAAAMPCVMVSTAMQGGCTCENASLLRIGTGNVEIAALFAPKPLGLTAADDWTKEMESKGFPDLHKLYAMLGAPDNVMLASLTHFKHNYNYVSRAHMYRWFNKHLNLGIPEPIVEGDHRFLTADELTVWDAKHPQPPGGDSFERALLQRWNADIQGQLDKLAFGSDESFDRYRAVVGGALQTVLHGRVPNQAGDFEFVETAKKTVGSSLEIRGLLKFAPAKTENPVVFFLPQDWNGDVAVWIAGSGKSSVYNGDAVNDAVGELLQQGISVAAIDLFQQGEFLPDGKREVHDQRLVKNPRQAAAYTFGYNDPLFARRVQDVLKMIGFVRTHKRKPRHVALIGVDGGGHLAAAARSIAGATVDVTCVNTDGFRFINVAAITDADFLPGGARYHDLPGMLAAAAPGRLGVAGEGNQLPRIVQRAYGRFGAAAHVEAVGDGASAAAKWVREQLAELK